MRTPHSLRRRLLAAASLLTVVGLTASLAGPARAGQVEEPTEPPTTQAEGARPADPQLSEDLAAYQAESGIRALSSELSARFGSDSAGSYLDAQGRLVVTVLTAKQATEAKRAGAIGRVVDDSGAALDRIMTRLNTRSEAREIGSVQGWRLDVESNAVVVTLTSGASDQPARAFARYAAKLGDVRFQDASAATAPTVTDSIHGGLGYSMTSGGGCSAGFNTVDGSNRPVVLTAGHCLTARPTTYRNGYYIGATRTVNYPTDDFATFWNSYPSYWVARPWVDMYNGRAMIVKGSWLNPPQNATVCKSGMTTGWTCGAIRSFNETVNYGAGRIFGLVGHNACVEPGDSGGSNMSAGGFALGLSSGASLYKTGPYANKCLSKTGPGVQNVSWYQPVGEALTRNGLRLIVG